MVDIELQNRINKTLSEIDARLKKNWEEIEFNLNQKLDDEWDFEDEAQKEVVEAVLDQLRAVRKILSG